MQINSHNHSRKPDGNHIKTTKNISFGLKISGAIILAISIIVSIVGLWSFTSSTTAISDYIDQIDKQYDKSLRGDGGYDAPIQIKQVFWGENVNSKYKKVKSLGSRYDNILAKLQGYRKVQSIHNKLVAKFNIYSRSDKVNNPIDGDIFKLTNKMIDGLKINYPKDKDQIQSFQKFKDTLSNKTNFSEIMSDMSITLSSNEQWLSQKHDLIEKTRTQFQKDINSSL